MREYQRDVLSIAGEWNIASLKNVATAFCVDTVTVENFATTLGIAHLYELDKLTRACQEFARQNLAAVQLSNVDVMRLPQENANLWIEFIYLKLLLARTA